MNQLLVIGQPILTTSNVEYDVHSKSNYANFPSNTSTRRCAEIDFLNGVLIWYGDVIQSGITEENDIEFEL